jgi:hypothetical protein
MQRGSREYGWTALFCSRECGKARQREQMRALRQDARYRQRESERAGQIPTTALGKTRAVVN